MLGFLAHMAINAAGFAALQSVWHDLGTLGGRWLQLLADHAAQQGERP
ncbi:UNVERIFIED_ORG: hypothetical protein M2348_001354 [Sphingomonas sp. R1F5B]